MMKTATVGAKRASGREFLAKRLMSFLGVFPLGLYIVAHYWTNISSLGGPTAFDAALRKSREHVGLLALEIILGLAIAVHTVVGLRLLMLWRPNNHLQRHFTNFKFLLQRIAAVGVGLFIIAHVINARVRPAFTAAGTETWAGMREAMHEPLTLAVYVLGNLGIDFHLANGLWTFLITWGLTVTPRSQRISQALSILFFLVLASMAGLSIYGFMQPMGRLVG